MNTTYPQQALDRLVRIGLSRDSKMLGVRPQPPKPKALVGGVLTLDEPKETANITHYKIYGAGGVLFEKVPVGQTKLIGFTETKAFLTAFDDRSEIESHEMAVSGTAATGTTAGSIWDQRTATQMYFDA